MFCEKEFRIKIKRNPSILIGSLVTFLGDFSAGINRGDFEVNTSTEIQKKLLISAQCLEQYIKSKKELLNSYFLLLCSASYFLCGSTKKASKLSRLIEDKEKDINGEGLGDLLIWILCNNRTSYSGKTDSIYGEHISKISKWFFLFQSNGDGKDKLRDLSNALRTDTYKFGSPRHLLLGDIISAIFRII